MRYEILFDAGVFRKQMALNSRRIYRRKLLASVLNLTVGIFLISQIFYPFSTNNIINYGIGCFFTLNALVYFGMAVWRAYSMKKLVNDYIYRNIPASTFLWEFTDECLNYREPQLTTTLEWPLFQSFEIIDKTLFLLTNVYTNPFILSEEEIGKVEFGKVITFLSIKIKPGKTVAKYQIQD